MRGIPYAVVPTFDNSNSTLDATYTGLSVVLATLGRDLSTYHATDLRLLPRNSDTCQKHDRRPTKNSRGTDAYTHRQSVKREDVSRRRWKYTRNQEMPHYVGQHGDPVSTNKEMRARNGTRLDDIRRRVDASRKYCGENAGNIAP